MKVNDPGVGSAAFERYERALLDNDLDALDAFVWRDLRLVRVSTGSRRRRTARTSVVPQD